MRKHSARHAEPSQSAQDHDSPRVRRRQRRAKRVVRPDEMVDTLTYSLDSTDQGLRLLLSSLERSGLGRAVGAYAEMRKVLRLQREWCDGHKRRDLDLHWQRLAATTSAICAILEPFTAVMVGLRDDIERPKVRGLSSQSHKLAEQLLRNIAVSHYKVSAAPEMLGAIRSLASAGLVEVTGWGRSRCYRLGQTLTANLVKVVSEAISNDQTIRGSAISSVTKSPSTRGTNQEPPAKLVV